LRNCRKTAQLRLLFLSDAHVVLEVSHGPPGGQAPIEGWILLYKERLTELGLQLEDSLTQFGFGCALDFGLAMMEPNRPPEYW
jgi:hypothetical protein